MNLRPSGYEPDELPGCSIPRQSQIFIIVFERRWAFSRFGGDLLSRGLSPSTIGAAVLNFRVRYGTGCFTCAMTTKPRKSPCRLSCGARKRRVAGSVFCLQKARCHSVVMSTNIAAGCTCDVVHCQGQCMLLVICLSVTGSNQAYRAISTGQLNALLRLHLRPIDVVVFHGPQGDLVLRGASRLDAFSGYPVRS